MCIRDSARSAERRVADHRGRLPLVLVLERRDTLDHRDVATTKETRKQRRVTDGVDVPKLAVQERDIEGVEAIGVLHGHGPQPATASAALVKSISTSPTPSAASAVRTHFANGVQSRQLVASAVARNAPI